MRKVMVCSLLIGCLPFVLPAQTEVEPETMAKIFETVKTPYKYGVVLKPEAGKLIDCPNVFRMGETWYMVYIVFDKNGYETLLATSKDLLRWKPQGKVLPY